MSNQPSVPAGKREAGEPRPRAPDQPESGTRLSALEIHDNILAPAERELERPASSLFMSALASGLTIGFSFLAGAYLSLFVSPALAPAAVAAGYPLGFIFVVLARSELFTENTLEPVIPFLHRRNRETAAKVLRLWSILLVGNLIGAWLFALVIGRTPLLQPQMQPALARLAEETTRGGFGTIFYQGIFGGWLIALLAWLLASTQATGAQIALVWLTTAPISAFHFRHSIVGSVEAFYRLLTGSAGWQSMAGEFIVPAVLGNAVGGVLLVAILNYGQVVAEHRERAEKERR
jgi:formate/nitrite transporter FocA (FNT family)